MNADGKEMAATDEREYVVGVLVKMRVFGSAADVDTAVTEFRRWSMVQSRQVESVDRVWMLPKDLPGAALEILEQLTQVRRNGDVSGDE